MGSKESKDVRGDPLSMSMSSDPLSGEGGGCCSCCACCNVVTIVKDFLLHSSSSSSCPLFPFSISSATNLEGLLFQVCSKRSSFGLSGGSSGFGDSADDGACLRNLNGMRTRKKKERRCGQELTLCETLLTKKKRMC